ncbi:MCE family protein [Mycobacterium sp. SMC-2]|uniref:MCE family protein n=1 Tax=Mycobacterium sp. SMC-2 TaxID=2857058 RepID=UPI0021B26908|nr:MCE family protein [Mycobacterium sp. SMC-2]UXA06157.1 MCE family protein [Mycobacterium sp. SMC-2]
MTGSRYVIVKFTVFAIVMVVLTGLLLFVFGQYRTGSTNTYSAVFADISRIKSGDSVRVAGVRVGTVQSLSMRPDKKVSVEFDADRKVALTTGTKVMVRYLNLVGDRYLELVDGPGTAQVLRPGSEIPVDRTAPALDLDLLLGGLKPVIRGLNSNDVNALSVSLMQVLQGQGGAVESLLSNTSSFTNALADNNQTVEQLIDNLRTLLGTLTKEGGNFSAAIERLERMVTELASERDPIGAAIDSLDKGTASLADLLARARSPLAGTIGQLNRLAPLLDRDKDHLDAAIRRAPENYRKLTRTASYGSFIQFYICGLTLRVSDLQGRTAVFPWFKQEGGRCGEP